ncbi:hypothetical protein PUR71_14860 [Streptomyces sp. SP17BM10]|uniref:hypothetical protein n=1 Tax=Streptomyces sp. SP17BM10 TaxID=3002530 RepID=UPI002E7714B9|nr:hypothetical protein [Streptomyces sp. SP17BM10]MEE1784168.1 hypothetical protein [Streptomyces sp. SP17BM10]
MPTVNLLLPAEPDILGDLYALEEALLIQLRPLPDEDGESWSPLPDHVDGEAIYQSYLRVLDALTPGTADVVYGRADLVPGVPVLISADGRTELVQLLDVQVEARDLIHLGWLRDELAKAEDDLAAFLDDAASDRHAPWWKGESTDGAAVAAWARRALAPVLKTEITREAAKDRADLLAVVRAGAGQERIELTAAQEEVYGRYMVDLIRATAATRVDAELTAFATGLL